MSRCYGVKIKDKEEQALANLVELDAGAPALAQEVLHLLEQGRGGEGGQVREGLEL